MHFKTPKVTFLTGLSLLILIEGCAGTIKPIPYVISVKHQLCQSYVVTKENPLTYAPSGKWLPLSDCEGFTAFSPSDTAEALREFRQWQAQNQAQ